MFAKSSVIGMVGGHVSEIKRASYLEQKN